MILPILTWQREFAALAQRKLIELRRQKADFPAISVERAEELLLAWIGRLSDAR
jgi:hypothetical protein